MSKIIRATTLVRRPAAKRDKRPVYIIASGGEVYILKHMKGALTWVPATEADFGARPDTAANDPSYTASNPS